MLNFKGYLLCEYNRVSLHMLIIFCVAKKHQLLIEKIKFPYQICDRYQLTEVKIKSWQIFKKWIKKIKASNTQQNA